MQVLEKGNLNIAFIKVNIVQYTSRHSPDDKLFEFIIKKKNCSPD